MTEDKATYIEEINKNFTESYTYKYVENTDITIKTSQEKLGKFVSDFQDFNYFRETENIMLYTVIRNLIKKNSFLQLSIQLAEEQISEDEFDVEIDNNPENFIIDLQYLKDKNELIIISEIIKRIGKDFSVDEVSEMFSIDLSEVNYEAIDF